MLLLRNNHKLLNTCENSLQTALIRKWQWQQWPWHQWELRLKGQVLYLVRLGLLFPPILEARGWRHIAIKTGRWTRSPFSLLSCYFSSRIPMWSLWLSLMLTLVTAMSLFKTQLWRWCLFHLCYVFIKCNYCWTVALIR